MRMIVFTIFCFLVDEKVKLKFLACYFEIVFFFGNPSSNPIQIPYCGNFECLQEAACDSVKSYR